MGKTNGGRQEPPGGRAQGEEQARRGQRKTGTAEVQEDMERLIFSKQLLEKTEQLRRSPVSVLEAPAGYGKTTAVT